MNQQHLDSTTETDIDDPYAARPWLRNYPSGVPADIEQTDLTVPDLIRHAAARYPDRVAFAYYGRHLTFREIDRLSSMFANRLIERGLQPGDRVLVVLANMPQYPIVHLGTMKAGGVVAALSPLLVEREIAELAADSGAKIIVALDRVWDRIAPLIERGVVERAIMTGPQDYLPTVKRLLYPLKYRKEMISVPFDSARGIESLRDVMKGASNRDPQVQIDPSAIAAFQYTGGTTGLPKAAVLTHRNLVANVLQVRAWVWDLNEGEETVLSILPFFHSYGVTLCLHIAAYIGATTILVPRFEIADVMEQIKRYQPTALPGVPTLYSAIIGAVDRNPARQASMRSIQYCISGGAPLPQAVQERFEELTGGRLVEGYGLSEASPVTHANPLNGEARIGTIGMPMPSTEARIVDLETRRPVPIGERGEIAVRGPQVMQGYWRRPEDTAAVLSDDGWLYTGDVGVMDEDGYFRIVDRQKDVIITGGENIYPREIEEVLYTHPSIADAAVIGVSHAVGGQIVKAFITAKPGEKLERRDVLQFCGERLAKYKVPRQIEFRASLPKSPSGKILRRALADEEDAKPRRRRASEKSADES